MRQRQLLGEDQFGLFRPATDFAPPLTPPCSFLSILVSNTAVVVFLFNPVATAASDAGMDLLPFVFVLMIASSAAYATPISYQTNLMVFGPGGYQFNDYLKFGGPLQIVSWVSTTIAVYAIWGEKKTLD